jgi:hypothetical protein
MRLRPLEWHLNVDLRRCVTDAAFPAWDWWHSAAQMSPRFEEGLLEEVSLWYGYDRLGKCVRPVLTAPRGSGVQRKERATLLKRAGFTRRSIHFEYKFVLGAPSMTQWMQWCQPDGPVGLVLTRDERNMLGKLLFGENYVA